MTHTETRRPMTQADTRKQEKKGGDAGYVTQETLNGVRLESWWTRGMRRRYSQGCGTNPCMFACVPGWWRKSK